MWLSEGCMLDNYCYSAQKEAISAISLKNFEKNVFSVQSVVVRPIQTPFSQSLGGQEVMKGSFFFFKSIYVHVMSGPKGSPKLGVRTSSLTKIPQKSEILGIG